MVNTQFSWSVYFCVYTSGKPPCGPCPWLQAWPQTQACRRVRRLCVGMRWPSRWFCWPNLCQPSVLGRTSNCCGISCHVSPKGEVAILQNGTRWSRRSIPYPYGVAWLLSSPRVAAARASRVLRTNFGITCYSCSSAWNDGRRGSRDASRKAAPFILSVFLRFIVRHISPFRVREICSHLYKP